MKSNNFIGAQIHLVLEKPSTNCIPYLTTKEHVGHEETKRRTKRRLTKIINTNLDHLVPVYSLTDWWWWQPHSYERQTALFL
jgi:hypothetical protein